SGCAQLPARGLGESLLVSEDAFRHARTLEAMRTRVLPFVIACDKMLSLNSINSNQSISLSKQ
ncbi:MAG: hypothetical protein ACRD82_04895, partial [Blastocatellia bacterium]